MDIANSKHLNSYTNVMICSLVFASFSLIYVGQIWRKWIKKVEGVGLMDNQQLIMTLVQILIWGGLIGLSIFGLGDTNNFKESPTEYKFLFLK